MLASLSLSLFLLLLSLFCAKGKKAEHSLRFCFLVLLFPHHFTSLGQNRTVMHCFAFFAIKHDSFIAPLCLLLAKKPLCFAAISEGLFLLRGGFSPFLLLTLLPTSLFVWSCWFCFFGRSLEICRPLDWRKSAFVESPYHWALRVHCT